MTVTFHCPMCAQQHSIEVPEEGGQAHLECGADLIITPDDIKKIQQQLWANCSVDYKVNGS